MGMHTLKLEFAGKSNSTQSFGFAYKSISPNWMRGEQEKSLVHIFSIIAIHANSREMVEMFQLIIK